MQLFIFLLSVFFVGIGLVTSENNARYLLAGYNTMSEKERSRVDIRRYIPFFRNFHLVLGASFLVLGLTINNFLGQPLTSAFLVVYPFAAYMFLLSSSGRFVNG